MANQLQLGRGSLYKKVDRDKEDKRKKKDDISFDALRQIILYFGETKCNSTTNGKKHKQDDI